MWCYSCLTLVLLCASTVYGVTNKPVRSANNRNDHRGGYAYDSYSPPKDRFVLSGGYKDPHRQDHYDGGDKYHSGPSSYGYGSSGHNTAGYGNSYGSHDKQYSPGEGGYGFTGGYPGGFPDYPPSSCCGGQPDLGQPPVGGGNNGGHYPNYIPGHYPSYGGHDPHYINEHKKAVLKGALLPLAGVALLGVAAALASNPVLLQLGVVSAGKRRRRSLTAIDNAARVLRTDGLSPYRGHKKA